MIKKSFKISILDYKISNLKSVKNALSYLGFENIITSDSNEILKSEGNFYNLLYSKSLFQDKRALIINRATDKFLKNLEKITQKNPNKVVLIIISETSLPTHSKRENSSFTFEKDLIILLF